MVGSVHNQGSAPVEWFKSLINKASDSLSHITTKLFGSTEDKKNLKSLDQIHASLIEIHVNSRQVESSIYKASKKQSMSEYEKNMFIDSLKTDMYSLKTQKIVLDKISIPEEKNTFIQKKKKEESHLIDIKIKHLEHLEKQVIQIYNKLNPS